VNNPKCDKQLGHCVPGEVRVLPTGSESNAILCRACFDNEVDWRKDQNDPLNGGPFETPAWGDLKVYEIHDS
jgi:hypothetical protein